MKNLPLERTKYRLWMQLVDSYIFWLIAKENVSTLWILNAEWELMWARLAYKHYKIVEDIERFIQ